jgi:hypothetical protein
LGKYPNCKLGNHEDQPQRLRLAWNAALETGGILVGEEITITLEVEFVKTNDGCS